MLEQVPRLSFSRSRGPSAAGRATALLLRIVDELQAQKKAPAGPRLKLGLGRDEFNLVFPNLVESVPRNPDLLSKEFAPEAARAKAGRVTFH